MPRTLRDRVRLTVSTLEGRITPANTPPVLGSIADSTTLAGESIAGQVDVTVRDAETPNAVKVTAVSSNDAVLPNSSITVGPVTNGHAFLMGNVAVGAVGAATVTVTATDPEGATAVRTFVVNRPASGNTSPQLDFLTDATLTAGKPAQVSLFFGDDQTASPVLSLTATSTNANVATVAITGTGSSRVLVVTPTAGATGTQTATVRVSVSDGALTTFQEFTATIAGPAANTAPTVTAVGSLTANVGAAFEKRDFTVGDAQTAAGSLTVTATSSNSTLVPVAGVALGGSGAARSVTVTPAAGKTGTATVTLTVTDAGGLAASTSFVVTVNPAGTPPPAPTKPVLVGVPTTAVGGTDGTFRVVAADGKAGAPVTPFPGFTGSVRVASADLNGDGVPDTVVGTGPGSATRLRVLDGKSGAELFAMDPFEASFTGGVFVAAGDVNGDGTPDLIVSPDEGGGPRVRVFSGKGFGQLADFFGIDDPAFRGGARVAAGDLNGDGVADLVVSAGFGGGPRVAVFDGKSNFARKLFGDFFAFEDGLRNGVFPAAGDVDGDGKADLVVGAGPGGGPRVSVFAGGDLLASPSVQTRLADYFAGDPNRRDGVRVAVKNLDGDAKADVVAAVGPTLLAYSGKGLAAGASAADLSANLLPGQSDGVFVG